MTDEDRAELRERTAAHAEGGNFSLLLFEDEAEELFYGRVPKRVREMAKTALDWYWEDLLEANAKKPRAKARKKSA